MRAASDDIDAFCDETGQARRRSREGTPVNATFPAEGSYDPALFPREQKERVNAFFDGGKPPADSTPVFRSVEDIDREIERLRPYARGSSMSLLTMIKQRQTHYLARYNHCRIRRPIGPKHIILPAGM